MPKDSTGIPGSRWRLPLIRVLLLVVVAIFAASSVYVSTLIVRRNEALQQTSRYSVSFTVSQAAVEVARLQAILAAAALDHGLREADAVRLWTDIVAGRIPLFETGEVGDFMREDPQRQTTLDMMKAALAKVEARMDALGQPGVAREMMTTWAAVNAPLTRLASAAHVESGNQNTRDLQELGLLHWRFSYLLIGMILASFALMLLVAWNNRLLSRANTAVQLLLRELRQTSGDLEQAHASLERAMQEAQTQNAALRKRDTELNTQNARFDAALNNMSQALCMADGNQRVIVCNSRFLSLFGMDPGMTVPGTSLAGLHHAVLSRAPYGEDLLRKVWEAQRGWAVRRASGTVVVEDAMGRALAVSHRPMHDGGWVATYEDVTAQWSAEARIRTMALHDSLTGLPNRMFFRERLEEALARHGSGRDDAAPVLFCLDLDNFKVVNDTMGHPAGDNLLKAVGERLSACVRGTDTVARLGGDEFAVLHTAATQADTQALAQRIIDSLGQPYHIAGRHVVTGVSIGIAQATQADTDADTLHQKADMALYRAKAAGRGTYRFFAAEMEADIQARLTTELDLHTALARREFVLFYQPILQLSTERVSGYEALLRWRHPSRGLVLPQDFIQIAEEIGLINGIGEWALRQACTDAAAWSDGLKVAVNLSPVQFTAGDVVGVVSDALRQAGLEAGRLELEITESVLLQNNPATVSTLQALRELGVRIALDDFGTGYSSLSYLRHYPFDKIKIDRSFVSEIGTRPDCEAIVDSIAGLAHTLGMTTTAEGIETADQLRMVRDLGCTEGQGYYFGMPRPLAELPCAAAHASRGLTAIG